MYIAKLMNEVDKKAPKASRYSFTEVKEVRDINDNIVQIPAETSTFTIMGLEQAIEVAQARIAQAQKAVDHERTQLADLQDKLANVTKQNDEKIAALPAEE